MSYQKITIVGNVGNISDLRYTQDGIAVVNFSVAVNRQFVRKDGTKHEDVTWYRIAAWRRQAEVVSQYVTNGKMVLVEGDGVKASVYTAQDGTPRASLEVTANTIRFLSPKDDTSDGGPVPPSGQMPDDSDIPF